MATITKRHGKRRTTYLVQIRRAGQPPANATFDTRAEAMAWAVEREKALKRGPVAANHTLAEAFERYAATVTTRHRGARWERIRFASLGRLPIARRMLRSLVADDFARLRDHELGHLSAGSILRVFGLLNLVLESARRDWGWIDTNVLRDVKRPPAPPSRERRVEDDEIRRLRLALDYAEDKAPSVMAHKIAIAFLFALETAMRKGEILGLKWSDLDLKARTATLPLTKNGYPRAVPLTARAVALLNLLPRGSERCFGIPSTSVDVLFRRARDRAGIRDLHFHDSRHEACHRLAARLEVQDLARVLGHRDLRSLMIYYHPTAAQLAERLAESEPMHQRKRA